jgi:glycosyltransferase involved in cell wall biosynthesis
MISLEAGGSELVIDKAAAGLTELGHDVILSVPRPVGLHPYRTVVSGSFYSQYLRSPFNYRKNGRDADVVIDVINGMPFFTPLWRRRKRTIGFIHHVHDEQWNESFSGLTAKFGRFIEMKIVPKIYKEFITVSASTSAELQRLGVKQECIRIVPNGLDPAPEGLPPKDEEPLFVMVARLVPNKRVSLLLEMWREVQKTTAGRLVIIGDGPERAALQAMGVPNCEFLGHVEDFTKDSYMSRATILLVTSRREGWGLTILEAARVGTPSLAFDAPGVRDAIVNGVTGVLSVDQEDFVEKWQHLASHPELLSALGQAALERSNQFTWEKSTQLLDDLLVDG